MQEKHFITTAAKALINIPAASPVPLGEADLVRVEKAQAVHTGYHPDQSIYGLVFLSFSILPITVNVPTW